MTELNVSKNLKASLSSSFINQSPLFAWDIENDDHLIKSNLKIIKYEPSKNKMTLELIDKNDEFLYKMIKGDGFLKFYIPKISLAFESEILEFNGSRELSIRLPINYKFYERRIDERVEVFSEFKIKLIHNKEEACINCADISMSSFSAFINKRVLMGLKIEDTYVDCEASFLHTKFKIDLCVQDIAELTPFDYEKEPYASRRVVFIMDKITDNNRITLQNFIILQKKLLKELV